MAQTNAKVNCVSENYDSMHNNFQDNKQSSFQQSRTKNANYLAGTRHNVPFDEYLSTSKYDHVESVKQERRKNHGFERYKSFPPNLAQNSQQYKHNPLPFEKQPGNTISQNFLYDSSTGISNATSHLENSDVNFHHHILNNSDASDYKKNRQVKPNFIWHRTNGHCDGTPLDFHNGFMTEDNFFPRSTNDTYENLKNMFIDQYDIKQRKHDFDQAQRLNKYFGDESFDLYETMPEVVRHLSLISHGENSRGKTNKMSTTPLSSASVCKQYEGDDCNQMRPSMKKMANFKNSLKLIKPPVPCINTDADNGMGECNGSHKNDSMKSDNLAVTSKCINGDHSSLGNCPQSNAINKICQKEPTEADAYYNSSDTSVKKELNCKMKDVLSKNQGTTGNQESSFRDYDNFPAFHRDLNDLASLERSKCNVLSVIDNGLHRIEQCRSGANLSTSKSKKTNLTDLVSESLQSNRKKAAVACSSGAIESDFISNMFKEYRCYHLENMKQEIKRIQYLDNLPDRWLKKKFST